MFGRNKAKEKLMKLHIEVLEEANKQLRETCSLFNQICTAHDNYVTRFGREPTTLVLSPIIYQDLRRYQEYRMHVLKSGGFKVIETLAGMEVTVEDSIEGWFVG